MVPTHRENIDNSFVSNLMTEITIFVNNISKNDHQTKIDVLTTTNDMSENIQGDRHTRGRHTRGQHTRGPTYKGPTKINHKC